MAHAKHLIFGSDIVITYGPLGYLMVAEFPQAEVWAVWIYHIALFTLWVQAIVRLQFAVQPGWFALLIGIALNVCGILMGLLPPDRIVLAVAAVTILILARLPKRSTVDLVVLGILSGLILLVKFNLGALAIEVYLSLVVICNWPLRLRDRAYLLRLAGYFALPGVCAAVTYALISGTLSTFPAFLRYSMEVASGYSEAMSYPGPGWQVVLALVSMAAVLALALRFRRTAPDAAAAAIPALAYMFFTYKSAVVRQDAYHAALFEVNTAIAAIFILVCLRSFGARVVVFGVAIVFGIAGFFVIKSTTPEQSTAVLARLEGKHSMEFLGAFQHFQHYADFTAGQEPVVLAPARLPEAVRNAIGPDTMDVFTYSVDRVAANGFNWDPRPIFQSYSAYTPVLDRLNAAHFESARRPRKILWEWMTVDGRYLPADEPLVFTALLNHYDTSLTTGPLSVMTAREKDRFTQPVPLPPGDAEVGKPFGVPKVAWNELAILRAEMHENLIGKLWTFLYRADPVTIEATLGSGSLVHERVVWRNLENGVIASDWFDGLPDLQTAFNGATEGVTDRIASLRLIAPRPVFFSSRVTLQWSKVGISTALPAALRTAPPAPPQLSTETLWTPREGMPIAVNCSVSNAGDRVRAQAANVDPQLLFPLGPRLGEFRTLIVKAKFSVRDDLEAFFGQQVNGRGLKGEGTISNRWVDVYIPVSSNPFWKTDHGSWLRFDPTSGKGAGTVTEIKAILGSTKEMQGSAIQTFPDSESHEP